MLVIAGTVAFEGNHFISVAVTSKKSEGGLLYPTLIIKLKDKDMNITSDDNRQIKSMYMSILKQLRGYLAVFGEYDVIQYAESEVDKLFKEIHEVNVNTVSQSIPQDPEPDKK
jgi:hypothetical protein